MNTRMDADTSDDAADPTEEPVAADTPADAEPAGEDADADTDAESDDFDHLDSLSDGAGCTEIWEHLSETRDGE